MAEKVGADRVCVALDRDTLEGNAALIEALAGRARWFKLGMGAYYAGGAWLADRVSDVGAKLFLDLKLHDIPATVEHAARSLRGLRPALATVHASGGAAMVRAAVEGFGEGTGVLGVTVLTSTGNVASVEWDGTISPAQIYYTGAACTGTAYLNAGGSSAGPFWGGQVLYSNSMGTLTVPTDLDANSLAPNASFAAVTIDNPTCGASSGSKYGYRLVATTASAVGLPSYPLVAPLTLE